MKLGLTLRLPVSTTLCDGFRINGTILSTASAVGKGWDQDEAESSVDTGLYIDKPVSKLKLVVTMAMGNCPKYLHVRDLVREEQAPLAPKIEVS